MGDAGPGGENVRIIGMLLQPAIVCYSLHFLVKISGGCAWWKNGFRVMKFSIHRFNGPYCE